MIAPCNLPSISTTVLLDPFFTLTVGEAFELEITLVSCRSHGFALQNDEEHCPNPRNQVEGQVHQVLDNGGGGIFLERFLDHFGLPVSVVQDICNTRAFRPTFTKFSDSIVSRFDLTSRGN